MTLSRGNSTEEPPYDDFTQSSETARKRLAMEAQGLFSFDGRRVRDITADFTAAAQQLPPGQLVKDEYFTLFEAVGALEIMDPKMDSGVVPPGDTFESTFNVGGGLGAGQLLWIMDELMCMEIAWHEGYPLSQTVFMSLHVDHLLSPENRNPYTFLNGEDPPMDLSIEEGFTHNVLRAYCLALVKCCQLTLQLVQLQNFYEEEDFVTHLFGRELLPKVEPSDTDVLLHEALSWLSTLDASPTAIQAIQARLNLRRAYLQALSGDDGLWETLNPLLRQVDESHHLAIPTPEGFSEKVQRKLATSTPPRPKLQLSWGSARAAYAKMSDDVVEANRLTSYWVCQVPHALQLATWAFAYRNPPPNTFARAYLQNLLFGSDRLTEDMTHFDLFLADIRDLVLAGDPLADVDSFQVELPSDPRHACSRTVEAFMEKAFDGYTNLYRMVCQNRCRIRRTFTQTILILDTLQSEAKRTDERIHEITPLSSTAKWYPLETWTAFHRLRIMIWTIQLGMETEIYLPDELCMMYWWMSCVTHALLNVLSTIESHLLERMRSVTKNRQAAYATQCLTCHDWLKSLRAKVLVTRSLSLTLWRFCGVLNVFGYLNVSSRDYAQEQLLFETRMKPYLSNIHDPLPRLEDFQRAQSNIKSVEAASNSIDLDLKDAKAALAELKGMEVEQTKCIETEEEWKREIKQLETTCVAIAVQVSQLTRLCAAGKKENIEAVVPPPGESYHVWWVVPQVREKKG